MSSLVNVVISLGLATFSAGAVHRFVSENGSLVGAVFLGAWFVFLVFVLTPYRLWKQERQRSAAIEADSMPRLAFERPRVESALYEDESGKTQRAIVDVRNIGMAMLEKCAVHIVAVGALSSNNIARIKLPISVPPFGFPPNERFALSPQQPQEIWVADLRDETKLLLPYGLPIDLIEQGSGVDLTFVAYSEKMATGPFVISLRLEGRRLVCEKK